MRRSTRSRALRRRATAAGIALFCVLLVHNIAYAQNGGLEPTSTLQDALRKPASSIAAASFRIDMLPVENWPRKQQNSLHVRSTFGVFGEHNLQPSVVRPVGRRRSGRQAAWAVLGGVAGLLIGGRIGVAIEGDSCRCDDPGFKGFLIGAPTGAAGGAILGAVLAQ